MAAANALELTVTEAIALGHNYVGCEHLLLGLVTEPDGAAGQVLRTAGAEARLTHRAVTAALAGYAHLRAQAPAPTPAGDPARLLAALDERLRPLLARIDGLERRLDSHRP
ncbi:Clp protease N-terminal domain-containing protein [Micromonospora sp. WMMA1923]|uniref:Clp protease N-terminal domain-containing protein n=1 Tax=Micromonospora sp. WMMA1923 TaxID=3404125 RepID=UPI003B9227DB